MLGCILAAGRRTPDVSANGREQHRERKKR
jgi:hypothetical protein